MPLLMVTGHSWLRHSWPVTIRSALHSDQPSKNGFTAGEIFVTPFWLSVDRQSTNFLPSRSQWANEVYVQRLGVKLGLGWSRLPPASSRVIRGGLLLELFLAKNFKYGRRVANSLRNFSYNHWVCLYQCNQEYSTVVTHRLGRCFADTDTHFSHCLAIQSKKYWHFSFLN